MKKSVLIATAMIVGMSGFSAGGANAGPFIPMILQGDHAAPVIYVGGKKKKKFAQELSRHLFIGALKTLPPAQEGELASCLEAADAEGLSPKKALRACMESLGSADDGEVEEEVVTE